MSFRDYSEKFVQKAQSELNQAEYFLQHGQLKEAEGLIHAACRDYDDAFLATHKVEYAFQEMQLRERAADLCVALGWYPQAQRSLYLASKSARQAGETWRAGWYNERLARLMLDHPSLREMHRLLGDVLVAYRCFYEVADEPKAAVMKALLLHIQDNFPEEFSTEFERVYEEEYRYIEHRGSEKTLQAFRLLYAAVCEPVGR